MTVGVRLQFGAVIDLTDLDAERHPPEDLLDGWYAVADPGRVSYRTFVLAFIPRWLLLIIPRALVVRLCRRTVVKVRMWGNC